VAHAETLNITECGTLGTANTVYTLANSVNIGDANCFAITAENVTIDCAGHTVTGNNNTNTYGVYSTSESTNVKNCVINDYDVGVYLYGANNNTLSNLNVTTNTGISIFLHSSSYNTLSNLGAVANPGYAIRLILSYHNVISNLTANSPGGAGYAIMLSSSNNNILTGINATTSSNDNGFGIFLAESSFNALSNINAIGTGGSQTSSAIHLSGSNFNNLSNINAIGSGNPGYAIDLVNSNSNSVYNNTLHSGNNTETLLYIASSSSANTFCWNNFTQTSGLYTDDRSDSNFYNGSACNGEGNIYANVMNGSVAINGTTHSLYDTGLYIGSSGTGYPYNSTNSQGKLLGNIVDYAPLTPYNFNNSTSPASCVCGVLSSPNSICTLTQNLMSAGTCFTVTAQNVTIDCAGHSIVGANAGSGIYSTQSNTKIKNCGILNFSTGISFNENSILNYNVISNNTISDTINSISINNSNYPGSSDYNIISDNILSTTSAGISISSSQYDVGTSNHNLISNNIISATTNAIFIRAGGSSGSSSGNTISNNTVPASSTGILISSSGSGGGDSNSDINMISNNTISASSIGISIDSGLYAFGTSNNNVISNNTIPTSSIGISISSSKTQYCGSCSCCGSGASNNNVISNNTISASSKAIFINAVSYTFGSTVNNNTISNNILSAATTGISISTNGDTSSIKNNTISKNTLSASSTGISLGASNLNNGNVICLNSFTDISGLYIITPNMTNNFFNCTHEGKNQGNLYQNVLNGSVQIIGAMTSSIPGYYVGTTGAGYPYNSINSLGKIFGSAVDYAPLTLNNVTSLQCGNLTTAGTIYNMSANVSIDNATCFTVTAENVTLDCNGHSITGSNTGNGIYSNQDYTAIKNCVINNFGTGIYFEGDYGTLSNVTATATGDFNNAIVLSSSSSNTLSDVTATATGDFGHAIFLTESSNNIISGIGATATASGNTYGYPSYAILLESSSNNILSNLTAIATGNYYGNPGYGINIVSGSNNTLLNLAVAASGDNSQAISLISSSENTLSNLTVIASEWSGNAIYLSNSPYNTISDLIATATGDDGKAIYLESGANYNTLSSLTAASGTGTAIVIGNGANGNTVRNVTMVSGNKEGLLLDIAQDSNGNTFCWNNFTETNGLYVNDLSGYNFYSSGICNGEGNIYANVIDNSTIIYGTSTSTGFPFLSIGSYGTGYPYRDNTSGGKFNCNFEDCIDAAPLTPNDITLKCGNLNMSGATYTMTLVNASINNSTCFNVQAEDITLDCDGLSIIGNNASGTNGIYTDQFNTTIRNCVIIGFEKGIVFDGANNGTITNVAAITTRYSYLGGAINLASSSNNVLSNITAASSEGNAIVLISSSYNELANLTATATGSGEIAINLAASSFNIFLTLLQLPRAAGTAPSTSRYQTITVFPISMQLPHAHQEWLFAF